MNLKRSLVVALAATAAASTLTGCVPLVATGIGAGTLMIVDRRTSGAYVEDEAIEWKTRNRIGERFGTKTNVNPTSYNRILLLTGEVPDNATRGEVERIAAEVPNVRAVTNETVVGPVSTFSTRGNDAYITSKIKARFVEAGKFSANHVKVVTESATVFLMGLVTQAEADAATEIARTTGGVQKVVRIFEYIGADQARQLDSRPPEAPPQPAAR
jgi:osmotically-inducible protein OsmY